MVRHDLFCTTPITLARAFCSRLLFWTTLADDNFIYTSQHAFSDGTTSWSWDLYKQLFPTQYLGEVDPSQVSFFVATTSDDGVVPVADVDAFVERSKMLVSTLTISATPATTTTGSTGPELLQLHTLGRSTSSRALTASKR